MPGKLKGLIAAAFAGGLVTLAVAVELSGEDGLGSPAVLAAFVVLLALNWAFPLFLARGEEAEAIHLDEGFLVAALLLLPPVGTLLAFGLAVPVAAGLRGRPVSRTLFNLGQQLISAGVAVGLMGLMSQTDGSLQPGDLVAAAVAAAGYFVANAALVSTVLALSEGEPFRRVWRDGIGMRVLVWAGGVCIGLLAGLAGSAYDWALALAVVPMVVLHAVSASHVRARRDRERMFGLFRTAVDAHASMGVGDVEQAIIASARDILRCRSARVDRVPPGEGELGARLRTINDPDRWLTVFGRRGVEPFDEADARLLDAIVAIAAPALDNAALFEQAEDERRKLADVVESSSDGIFSVADDQRVLSWNPAMERITGFPAEEVLGSRCFTVFRPRDDDGNELCVASCPGRCNRTGVSIPVQVKTITGEPRWLSCTWSSLPEGGYVVMARDVTAEKQVADLKADFLANISHELRTPLTPIQGFLQTLLRDDVNFDDAGRRHIYEVMLRQSQRLERLVQQLLEATMLADDSQLFLPEVVDWGSAADRVVAQFRDQEPDREFVLEAQAGLPRVVADANRAEQVLNNLITNAVKYSPPGEPVRVTVESRGRELATTVTDRGPGIPPSDRERVFERFTRLGDHLTRPVGGAGLGLFIARRLVEVMGGTIAIGDAAGGGAAITFTLPVYDEVNART